MAIPKQVKNKPMTPDQQCSAQRGVFYGERCYHCGGIHGTTNEKKNGGHKIILSENRGWAGTKLLCQSCGFKYILDLREAGPQQAAYNTSKKQAKKLKELGVEQLKIL